MKKSTVYHACILLMTAFFLNLPANAEMAVIVHPSNAASLDKAVISKIFLGKTKKFPGGGAVVPLNQAEGSAPRQAFNQNVLSKSSAQLKAYWSKLVFTGKGTPPKDVSVSEAKSLVAANPNFIGYIDSAEADSSVKVVMSF